MSARLQVGISAAAVPACAFIVLQRLAIGQPWWAAMWLFIGAMHGWLLVDTLREICAQRQHNEINGDKNERT